MTFVALSLLGATLAQSAAPAKPAKGRREAIELLSQGRTQEEQKNLKEAARLYKQSVDLAPSPAGYYHLGHVYAEMGDKKQANSYLKQALGLAPDYELAKLELQKLAGKDVAGLPSGSPDEMLTAMPPEQNGAVNYDNIRREYQTLHSLKKPEVVASAAPTPEVPSYLPGKNSRGFLSSFIPRAPQNPGAGDKPGIPLAAPVPTAAGTARQSVIPPSPTYIENDSPAKVISPEEPALPGAAPKSIDSVSASSPAQRVLYKTEPPAPPPGESRPAAPATGVDGRARTVMTPSGAAAPAMPERPGHAPVPGGAAKNSAAGGSALPPVEKINQAAFGPEAQMQPSSTGYGTSDKIVLNTFAFHKDRADSYRKAERWKDAADEYQTALKLNPSDVDTRTLYAEMLSRAGQADEGQKQFGKAETAGPQNSQVHYHRGNLYRDQKKYDLAIGAYRQALAIEPTNKFVHNNLGVVYMEKGDYEKAVTEFKKVLELDPKYDKAMLNLGIIYDDQLSDPQNALKYYDMYVAQHGERSGEVRTWADKLRATKTQ